MLKVTQVYVRQKIKIYYVNVPEIECFKSLCSDLLKHRINNTCYIYNVLISTNKKAVTEKKAVIALLDSWFFTPERLIKIQKIMV